MIKNILKRLNPFISLVLVAFMLSLAVVQVMAQEEQEVDITSLQEQIEEKQRELEEVAKERKEIEEQLERIGHQKSTLKNEVASIDYRINQLNFAIESNTITLERLALELESLRQDITETERSIKSTKQTIANLLVQLQQVEDQSLLVILLRNDSLADSVSDIQSIISLSDSLTDNIDNLLGLRSELARSAEEVEEKKESQESERRTLLSRQNLVEEQKQEKQFLLSQTKNQERSYEQKLEEVEEKQQEISNVVAEIEERLRESFDPDLLPSERPGVIEFPVEDSCVTQHFGKTEFAEQAYRSQSHSGVDFRASPGEPIFAVADGEVSAVDNNDKGVTRWEKFQYGKYVMVDHENNLSSLYAHLSGWVVQAGERVKAGELIGYSGTTGYIFGPHLHFGIYWTPSVQYESIPPAAGLVPVGVTVDPAGYFPGGSTGESCG